MRSSVGVKWLLICLAVLLTLTAIGCAGEETDAPLDALTADSQDAVPERLMPETSSEESVVKERLAPEFTSEILQVRRNEIVTVTVNGLPNTEYTILVRYHSGHESTANGLGAAMSDENGDVTWTWRVGGKTGFGTATFVVSGAGEETTYEFEVVE